MNIYDLDLTSLRYNPADEKDLERLKREHTDAFLLTPYDDPKLNAYDNQIMTYIILVYDMNSPLHRSVKTHNERKVQAMLMCGFKPNELGKFDQREVENALLYGKDKGVAYRIVKYVYLFNNVDYSELMGMLEYNSQLLLKIHNGNTNNQTIKELQQTSARIKELTGNVFGGKETKEIEEQLYEQLAMSRISYRPEMVARMLMSGQSEDLFVKDIYKAKGGYKKVKRRIEHGDA
jgi:hypothetical protein